MHEAADAAGIPFSDLAAVGALIIHKIVLIADTLPFINRFPERTLICNMISRRSFVSWQLFSFASQNISLLIIKYGSFRETIERFGGEIVWPVDGKR